LAALLSLSANNDNNTVVPSHSIKLPRRLAFVRAPMADLFLSYRELVNKGFDLNQGPEAEQKPARR
jgi:hypothetical protein